MKVLETQEKEKKKDKYLRRKCLERSKRRKHFIPLVQSQSMAGREKLRRG